MYKLRSLHEMACKNVRVHFANCDEFKKSAINVWMIPFKNRIHQVFEPMYSKLTCQDYFVVVFWMTILLATIGLVQSLMELYYVCNEKYLFMPKTFYNRTYARIPVHIRRNGRVFGLIYAIISLMLLLFGLMKFKTIYMELWIHSYGIILGLEIVHWIYILFYKRTFELKPLLCLLLLLLRWTAAFYMKFIIEQLF
jgi:hypothetical protein